MVQFIPIDQINDEGFGRGEKDEYLLELLRKQIQGEIVAKDMIIDLDDIEPFCKTMKIKQQTLDILKNDIKNGQVLKLLVYYKNGKFIMSDDYHTYYAYKDLEFSKVPCSVLGPIPKEYAINKNIEGK